MHMGVGCAYGGGGEQGSKGRGRGPTTLLENIKGSQNKTHYYLLMITFVEQHMM